jgi:hypothetical protein
MLRFSKRARFNELHFPVCRLAVVDIAPKTVIDNDQPTAYFWRVDDRKDWFNKISQSKVDWVISSAG